MLEECFPGGRQLYVALVAYQELRAERALERLDLLRETGLRYPESFRRAPEVFLLRNGNEIPQVPKLQGRYPHDVASRAGWWSSFHRHPRADLVARVLLRGRACGASMNLGVQAFHTL
jgi:hypothetical protein